MKYLSKANNRISFLRINNSSIVVLYYCNILSFFVCLFVCLFVFIVLYYLLTLFRCHVCSCWKKGPSCHHSVTDRRKTWCSGHKPDQPARLLWRWCAGSPDPPAAARSSQPRLDFRSQTFRRVSAGGSAGQGVGRSRAPILWWCWGWRGALGTLEGLLLLPVVSGKGLGFTVSVADARIRTRGRRSRARAHTSLSHTHTHTHTHTLTHTH